MTNSINQTQMKHDLLTGFQAEEELEFAEPTIESIENQIISMFETLPKDRQQAVLGQLYDIMKPEIPDTRIRKSYFNY